MSYAPNNARQNKRRPRYVEGEVEENADEIRMCTREEESGRNGLRHASRGQMLEHTHFKRVMQAPRKRVIFIRG